MHGWYWWPRACLIKTLHVITLKYHNSSKIWHFVKRIFAVYGFKILRDISKGTFELSLIVFRSCTSQWYFHWFIFLCVIIISLNCDVISINETAPGATVLKKVAHEQNNKNYKENKAVSKQNKKENRLDIQFTKFSHTSYEAAYHRKHFYIVKMWYHNTWKVSIMQLSVKFYSFSNFKTCQQSRQHCFRLPFSEVISYLIAKFMGPTKGPSGADRIQVGPMLAPWTLLYGIMLTPNPAGSGLCGTWQLEYLSHIVTRTQTLYILHQ